MPSRCTCARSRHAVSRPRGSRRHPIPTRSGHHCDPATREQAQPDTGRSVRTYHDGPSSVIEGGEGEDGVPQISPSEIFHARLEMLASQREAHAVGRTIHSIVLLLMEESLGGTSELYVQPNPLYSTASTTRFS
ncbi:hypothetical protein FOZ62_014480, partial [Perkinsus olseni]